MKRLFSSPSRFARLALVVLASGITIGCGRSQTPKVPAQRCPNLILIVSDDLGYGELGCYGGSIPTPHIDAISGAGIRFTQAYAASPFCSPSRAGLLTGRYPTRFGHEWNEPLNVKDFGLPLSEVSLPERLHALGYATCAIGKWHLGQMPKFQPQARGFDEFYGTLTNSTYFHPVLLDSQESPMPQQVQSDDFYTTDAYARRASDWVSAHRHERFFLYLAFNAPHTPLQVSEISRSRFSHITDPNLRDLTAIVSSLDDAVGLLLRTLRENNLEEDTIVVFTSDNGAPHDRKGPGNGKLRGWKGTVLEGGIRVPMLLQWKGRFPGGRQFTMPTLLLDVFPTFISAAGGQAREEARIDGVDLLPYLDGTAPEAPHSQLFWRLGRQWAVRVGDWKLTAAAPDKLQVHLCDLTTDAGETSDFSQTDARRVEELKTLWESWNREQSPARWLPSYVERNAAKK